MMRTTALIVLFALGLAAPAAAQLTSSDRRLVDQISDQVERYTQYTIFDSVTATVDNGHVVLAGWVTVAHKRDDIERRVSRLEGVQSVTNTVRVLPESIADDQLRFRIARAIYGHSSFWHYASLPNPPIKIIVNDGRVVLDGVVGSNLERVLARSLASGFGAADIRNELRTDAEAQSGLVVERQ